MDRFGWCRLGALRVLALTLASLSLSSLGCGGELDATSQEHATTQLLSVQALWDPGWDGRPPICDPSGRDCRTPDGLPPAHVITGFAELELAQQTIAAGMRLDGDVSDESDELAQLWLAFHPANPDRPARVEATYRELAADRQTVAFEATEPQEVTGIVERAEPGCPCQDVRFALTLRGASEQGDEGAEGGPAVRRLRRGWIGREPACRPPADLPPPTTALSLITVGCPDAPGGSQPPSGGRRQDAGSPWSSPSGGGPGYGSGGQPGGGGYVGGSSGGGCEGDSSSGGCEGDSGGGCEGDSGGGCEGDSSGGGCEGDGGGGCAGDGGGGCAGDAGGGGCGGDVGGGCGGGGGGAACRYAGARRGRQSLPTLPLVTLPLLLAHFARRRQR